jgi:putative ABC transport system permease protein
MRAIYRNLKVAVRHLLKSPGFTLTAVLMLALGIGATTAIFSIVDGVLLRPLPFPHSDRLMVLSDVLQSAGGGGDFGVTAPDIRNYMRDTHGFSSLGAYQLTGFEFSGSGEPTMLSAARMTGGVFPALSVQPLLGRVFTQQEDSDHAAVTVLSYSFWQKRFHGEADILGRKILLDRNPYIVIGVMPRIFEFPLNPGRLNNSQLWVPMSFTPMELSTLSEANWQYNMVGRLKPGVTPAQAQADAALVAEATMRSYPGFMAGIRIRPDVHSLHEDAIGDARPLVRTLFLAVLVVLLIACANLAGLLLVRALRRRREVAVRLALGAPARVLLRQVVLESLVLSVTGGLLGLALAAVVLRAGLHLLPDTLPLMSRIGLNLPVAGFAMALSVLTGLLCGLAPAFASMRTNMNDTLKEGGRTGTKGGAHARVRSALVVLEIAVALVLLVASGLLLRSFEKMRQVSLGFQPDHTVVAAYALPAKQYTSQASVDQFNQELLRRLDRLPGVRNAALTSLLPASGQQSGSGFVAQGYTPPKGQAMELGTVVMVQGDYLHAMGIPLLRGRQFTQDDRPGSPLVVIVNKQLAERNWPGHNPIGKQFRIGTPNIDTPWATVVGEVGDVKDGSPALPANQQYFIPSDKMKGMAGNLASALGIVGNSGYVVLRTSIPPQLMENALRATVRAIDPQLPLTQMQTMQEAVSTIEAPRTFYTTLISAFAGIALLLAMLGIYSVIAFSVALRAQEMAIRLALGSQRAGIVRLVLYSGAKLAALGCAIGLVAAAASGQLLHTFLFGVSALDPAVLVLSAVCVLGLSVAASLLPARKAATADPLQVLRSE